MLKPVRGAGALLYDRKCDWLWIRVPVEKMKYLFKFIFSFLRFGVRAKQS